MSTKAVYFLKKALGEDLLESLQKTELYKPDTRSVTSLEDIHLGLKLVPRTVMALLIRELAPMAVGEHKEIQIPTDGPSHITVEKLGPDVYSGQVFKDIKKIADFSHRPIPGVALIVMSSFELYEAEAVGPAPAPVDAQPGSEVAIMKLIEERLALHDLINRVVDKKLEQKDAIQQLMLARITSAMNTPILPAPMPIAAPIEVKKEIKIEEPIKKGSPLKGFLDGRQTKLNKNEFFISLEKNDTVDCGDCGKEIFNDSGYNGCICYGADRNSKISIKKSESGVKISFGKGWDQENLEMLLEVLRSKRG